MMSGFVNAGDNTFPPGNTIVKTTVPLLLSPFRIRDTLTDDNVDILMTLEFRLQRQLSNMYCN